MDEVGVGESVLYSCGRGMKFSEDLDQESQEVKCLQAGNGTDGTWSEPNEWPQCVESEIVSKTRGEILLVTGRTK